MVVVLIELSGLLRFEQSNDFFRSLFLFFDLRINFLNQPCGNSIFCATGDLNETHIFFSLSLHYFIRGYAVCYGYVYSTD